MTDGRYLYRRSPQALVLRFHVELNWGGRGMPGRFNGGTDIWAFETVVRVPAAGVLSY
jgi:hypothetical protein